MTIQRIFTLSQTRSLAFTNTTPSTLLKRSFSTTMSLLRQQHKLVVTRTLPTVSQQRIENGFEGIDIVQWKEDSVIPRKDLLEMVKGADGLLCLLTEKIDRELLDAAGPQLKVVSTMSVGLDHIDKSEVTSRNIALGYTPGVLTDATADIAMLLVLSASRRLRESADAVITGKWGTWSPTWLLGGQLSGKTVGIVGLGSIGTAVAKRMKAFGVNRIIYQGTRRKEDLEKDIGGQVEFVPKDQLLSESDVICVCCELNEKTKNMFDDDAFSKMKKTCVFVNIARGPIVDQDALVRALREGKVGSVGLDVTVPEPLPVDSELLKFPNCIVLPHIGSATIETRTAMSEIAIENALSGIRGTPLPSPVN